MQPSKSKSQKSKMQLRRVLHGIRTFSIYLLVFVALLVAISRVYSFSEVENQAVLVSEKSETLSIGGIKRHPTLILFATVDNDEETYRRDNLRYFLTHGLLNFPEYEYVVIVNGCHRINFDEFKKHSNFHLVERENICFDAGAWLEGLNYMDRLGHSFSRFIFLNSSVRGPFIPGWVPDELDWVAAFTSHLSSQVKMVGTSINCLDLSFSTLQKPKLGDLHIQSMAFATDDVGLNCCIRNVLEYPPCDKTWEMDDVIWKREVAYSKSILKKGYSLHSNLQAYHDIDISIKNRDEVIQRCIDTAKKPVKDLYFNSNYGDNININPLEVMFFKTNRDVEPQVLQMYTQWNDPLFDHPSHAEAFLKEDFTCSHEN